MVPKLFVLERLGSQPLSSTGDALEPSMPGRRQSLSGAPATAEPPVALAPRHLADPKEEKRAQEIKNNLCGHLADPQKEQGTRGTPSFMTHPLVCSPFIYRSGCPFKASVQ